jgi:flavin-dependent dehydrogenase
LWETADGGCMGHEADVCVIGGGPAGLAAAIAASQKGFRVTVADGVRPPIDKPCGEGLMPDALATLRTLGVSIGAEDGCAFRGIRFVEGNSVVEANFPDGPGLGIRRTVLHEKMVERAAALGIQFLWNTPVTGICAEGVLARSELISAKWVIGADGIRSRVRRWSGLGALAQNDCRIAYRQHYRLKPWSDCTEIHWAEGKQAYVTAVSREEICVTVISRPPGKRVDTSLREFPALGSRLEGASPTSVERGTLTSMHRLERVCRGNVALIGDASGSVDAITGEGLCLSFHQASALAEALEAGELRLYAQRHRKMALRPALMARLMLTLDAHSDVRKRVFRALAHGPEVFARLLAVHVGATSPMHLAATSALLGWRLLAA